MPAKRVQAPRVPTLIVLWSSDTCSTEPEPLSISFWNRGRTLTATLMLSASLSCKPGAEWNKAQHVQLLAMHGCPPHSCMRPMPPCATSTSACTARSLVGRLGTAQQAAMSCNLSPGLPEDTKPSFPCETCPNICFVHHARWWSASAWRSESWFVALQWTALASTCSLSVGALPES